MLRLSPAQSVAGQSSPTAKILRVTWTPSAMPTKRRSRCWASFVSTSILSMIDAQRQQAALQLRNHRSHTASRLIPRWSHAPGSHTSMDETTSLRARVNAATL